MTTPQFATQGFNANGHEPRLSRFLRFASHLARVAASPQGQHYLPALYAYATVQADNGAKGFELWFTYLPDALADALEAALARDPALVHHTAVMKRLPVLTRPAPPPTPLLDAQAAYDAAVAAFKREWPRRPDLLKAMQHADPEPVTHTTSNSGRVAITDPLTGETVGFLYNRHRASWDDALRAFLDPDAVTL